MLPAFPSVASYGNGLLNLTVTFCVKTGLCAELEPFSSFVSSTVPGFVGFIRIPIKAIIGKILKAQYMSFTFIEPAGETINRQSPLPP